MSTKPNKPGTFQIGEWTIDEKHVVRYGKRGEYLKTERVSGPPLVDFDRATLIASATSSGPATSEEIAAVNRALHDMRDVTISEGSVLVLPSVTVDVNAARDDKPTQLAAGQVWERAVGGSMQRRTLTVRDPDDRLGGEYWHFAEKLGASTPAWALLTMDEWRYLGTREEVAARERAAIEAHVEHNTDLVKLRRAEEAATRELIAARCHAEAAGLFGTRPYLAALFARFLDVPNAAVHLDDSAPPFVAVWADGCPSAKIAEAIRALKRELPFAITFGARACPPLEMGPSAVVAKIREADRATMPRTNGTMAGLLTCIGLLLNVAARDVHIDDSVPGTVAVTVDGRTQAQVAAALKDQGRLLPMGVRFEARGGLASPYSVDNWIDQAASPEQIASIRKIVHEWKDRAEPGAHAAQPLLSPDPLPGPRLLPSSAPPLPDHDQAPAPGESDDAFTARRQRVEVRREVDRLIAADGGPFAKARAAALRAWAERSRNRNHTAAMVLHLLQRHESFGRGGKREVGPIAATYAAQIDPDVLAVYERERAR